MFTRVITDTQIDTVQALANEIWHEHFTPIIGAGQVGYMLDKFQSREAITDQITNQGYSYFLITLDGEAVGYIGIQIGASELFLSKFYLRANERAKGIGRRAVEFLCDISKERDLEKISLTVNRNNSGVITAYKKMGFNIVSTQVKDIGGGYVMDDYIMEKIIG